MAGLLSVLSRSAQAERSVAAGIDGIAQNIANVNNPDYRRQEISFRSLGTGGIDVVRLRAAATQILETDVLNVTSDESFSDLTNQHYQSVSQLIGFDADEPYILTRTNAFIESWRNLQARPESAAAQEEVRSTALALTEEVQSLSNGLHGIREELNGVIREEVNTANNLIQQIAALNVDISEGRTIGTDTSSAEAVRNGAIRTLSEIVNVRATEDAQGRVSVYTGGGQPLVGGASTSLITYESGPFGDAEIRVGGSLVAAADGRADFLSPGRLRAHFNFVRGTDASAVQTDKNVGVLAKLENALDAIAEAWVDTETEGSFARTYAGVAAGETTPDSQLNNAFFTLTEGVPSRLGFTLRSDVLEGTRGIDSAALFVEGDGNLITVLESQSRSFNAQQLDLPAYWQQNNRDYSGIVRGIFAQVASGINAAQSNAITETHRLSLIEQELANATGINIDEELAQLTVLQNSYAANARVFQVAQELIAELLSSIR